VRSWTRRHLTRHPHPHKNPPDHEHASPCFLRGYLRWLDKIAGDLMEFLSDSYAVDDKFSDADSSCP
jgi:hypothetical protein